MKNKNKTFFQKVVNWKKLWYYKKHKGVFYGFEKVVCDFKREMPHADIYVYDNNSNDGTDKIARENGSIVRYEYKQGKGNVVRSMFRDIDAECYLMIDGDDTYPA